jgi:hypothetical protein
MNTTTTKKHPASDARAMQDNLGGVGNSITNLASDQYERATIRRRCYSAQPLCSRCRGERVDHYDTVRRRKDESLIDISLTVSPLRDADGRIIGASKIARDITERKGAQEQQKLLVNEMKHRIKNSLATIQAIATQTPNQHPDERDAFIARLHALDNAHDLLTFETGQSVPLNAIVTRALEPFQQQHRRRITVDHSDRRQLR